MRGKNAFTLASVAFAALAIAMPAIFVTACSDALLGAVSKDVEQALANDPTIEVLRGSTPIVDGSVVDWGNNPRDSTIDVSFQIKNTGTGNLLLETPAVVPELVSDGFSLVSIGDSSVASGASTTMVLRFHPASASTYDSAVTIASNAKNDASVAFDVTGVGTAPDTDPPTGSVSINSGAAYATGTGVTLSISASDTGGGKVTQMEVRNDNAFTGNWQAYATSLPWSLTAGDGTKAVYIRFRDGSGNLSGGYSDTIILDTVNLQINSISPIDAATNQPRATNITINFSENVDQSTLTASTVYLRVKNGSTVATTMTKNTSSVTLDPNTDLSYGIDYTVIYTMGIKDLAGRSLSSDGSATFTVERDIWEGVLGNESPATAYDLDMQNPYGEIGHWFDFVSNLQEEEWSPPTGANSTLARLEGMDYYRFTIPADSFVMRVQLFYTNDETNGTIIDSTPTESLSLSVMSGGAGLVAGTIRSDFTYSKDYDDYDVSGRVGEDCLILVQSSNYANRRKYNLRVYVEPGI